MTWLYMQKWQTWLYWSFCFMIFYSQSPPPSPAPTVTSLMLGGGFILWTRKGDMVWLYMLRKEILAVLVFVLWIFILRGGTPPSDAPEGRREIFFLEKKRGMKWLYMQSNGNHCFVSISFTLIYSQRCPPLVTPLKWCIICFIGRGLWDDYFCKKLLTLQSYFFFYKSFFWELLYTPP